MRRATGDTLSRVTHERRIVGLFVSSGIVPDADHHLIELIEINRTQAHRLLLLCIALGLSLTDHIQLFVCRFFAPWGEKTTHNNSTMLPQATAL